VVSVEAWTPARRVEAVKRYSEHLQRVGENSGPRPAGGWEARGGYRTGRWLLEVEPAEAHHHVPPQIHGQERIAAAPPGNPLPVWRSMQRLRTLPHHHAAGHRSHSSGQSGLAPGHLPRRMGGRAAPIVACQEGPRPGGLDAHRLGAHRPVSPRACVPSYSHQLPCFRRRRHRSPAGVRTRSACSERDVDLTDQGLTSGTCDGSLGALAKPATLG
jgi:hypothetical protein